MTTPAAQIARPAAVVARGHRDILIVGRGEGTAMYDVRAEAMVPLLERAAGHDGSVDIMISGGGIVPAERIEALPRSPCCPVRPPASPTPAVSERSRRIPT